MGADERHYNINHLNKWFGIAALILLTAVGLLVLSDYSRKWKDYQSLYQDLEIEKSRVKYDSESKKLLDDPDYKKLQEERKTAQADYQKVCPPTKIQVTQKQLHELTTQSEILKQQFRVVKGQFDAAKFQYEESIAKGHSDHKIAEIRYKSIEQKVKQLNLAIQTKDAEIAGFIKELDHCASQLKELERKERTITKKVTILDRKLKKIDPNEMNLLNQLANLVRNLPILDLANPTNKIQQVVLKDIRDDVNFMTVPKVDRCTTCHLGIANPDYKDAAQPLRTHPKLELYVAKNSPHALEDFGCTVCHDGRGRGTDFVSAAHTPSSKEQEEEWKKKYGWHELIWEKPMLPKQHVEASCFKCHSGQTQIKGADQLNLGMNLIERAGCYACHTIEKYKDWPKPGPDLTHLPAKTDKDWTYRWLNNPAHFRDKTWMPSFFNQSNNSDPVSKARSEQEIHAIVHYLFNESDDFKVGDMPEWSDPKKGEALVAAIGCYGCHKLEHEKQDYSRTQNDLRREQGPNLIGFGSKTNKSWIYQWLKNPKRYHPGTRMPNLRLTDQEAADIAAFLSKDKNDTFNSQAVPQVNESVLNDIVFDFLRKSLSDADSRQKLAQLKREEKLTFAGQKLIGQYGCYSCHEIKGFKGYKPIGAELTEEGSKPAEKLDFGYIDIEHTKHAWFNQKLKDPRIFDQKKIKAPDEKLRMPNYHFTDEEAEAITTAILGFVKDKPGKIVPRTPDNLTLEKGQRVIREFNCQGCHLIDGQGMSIKPQVKKWLIDHEGKDPNEADALALTFSPPNLIGEGKKVQTQWLFEFLHNPESIRPWLQIRMPSYGFDATHQNIIIKYFNALDKEEFPFTEYVNTHLTPTELDAAQKLFSSDYFDCMKCHIVGKQMPKSSIDSWAPDFTHVEKRLKPEWIIDWIKNPPALLPGTKMPAFFDPKNFNESGPPDILNGDENEQIRVLRNYIMSISQYPLPKIKEQPAPSVAAPQAGTAQPQKPAEGDDIIW